MTWYSPDWDQPTVFLQAVATGDEARARAMLDEGFEAFTARSSEGDPPQVLAARFAKPAMVRLLIERGADIRQPGAGGLTVLHYAAAQEALVPMIGWLLERGADLEARARFGATPLLQAIAAYCPPGAYALLERGADVMARDAQGSNAVFCLVHSYKAFRRGADHGPALRLLRTLLARGVDPNARGWLGRTPVTEAAELGLDEALALLCEYGGTPAGAAEDGLTALQAAALAGKPETAAQLRQRRAPLDVFSAIALGDLATVRGMLAENPALAHAVLAPRRTSALGLAIGHGHAALVRLLLEAGADPNGPTQWTSSLHAAVKFLPDPAIVELLIRHGANVDAADGDGNTPLNLAARSGDLALARLLIAHGADVNARTERGYTPMVFAKTDEMRALLRQHGGG